MTDGAGVPTGTPLPDPPLIESISEDPVLRDTKMIAEAWDCDGLNQVCVSLCGVSVCVECVCVCGCVVLHVCVRVFMGRCVRKSVWWLEVGGLVYERKCVCACVCVCAFVCLKIAEMGVCKQY